MKKIRYSIYVLLSGLFLAQVNFASGTELQDCPTSPIHDEENKKNIIFLHQTTPVDHGTTPVDLARLSEKIPSYSSFGNLQRFGSNIFSVEDLALLEAYARSPKKTALLGLPTNALHGTSPVGNGGKK